MKDKKYLYPGLAAIFVALITALSWVYLAYSSPGTTVIGENISTTNLTVLGNASTTGTLNVAGVTTITNNLIATGTATFATNFKIDSSGNASTTGGFIVGGTATLATTTITDLTVTTASSTNLNVSSNATSSNLSVTEIFRSGSSASAQFYIDSSGNASTTGDLIVGGNVTLATTTIGGGTPIRKHLSATGTVGYAGAEIATSSCITDTITVTDAAAGDTVVLGPPSDLEAGLVGFGLVSGVNTVTVRLCNLTGPGIASADKTWRFDVWQH